MEAAGRNIQQNTEMAPRIAEIRRTMRRAPPEAYAALVAIDHAGLNPAQVLRLKLLAADARALARMKNATEMYEGLASVPTSDDGIHKTYKGLALFRLGRFAEARTQLEDRQFATADDEYAAAIALGAPPAEAAPILRILVKDEKTGPQAALGIYTAVVEAALGNREASLAALDGALGIYETLPETDWSWFTMGFPYATRKEPWAVCAAQWFAATNGRKDPGDVPSLRKTTTELRTCLAKAP